MTNPTIDLVADQNSPWRGHLSAAERSFLNRVAAFAADEVAPHAAAWEEAEELPRSVFQAAGEVGLLGVTVPRKLGGRGFGYAAYALAIRELARYQGALAIDIAAHNALAVGHILLRGSKTQHRRVFPKLVNGDWLGAWALTEPEAGSDSGGVQTVARPDGDGAWVLNGFKRFITLGRKADVLVVMARSDSEDVGRRPEAGDRKPEAGGQKPEDGGRRTEAGGLTAKDGGRRREAALSAGGVAKVEGGRGGEEGRRKEISAFLVEKSQIKPVRKVPTCGLRASETSEFKLVNARGEMLGERGSGHTGALACLDKGRIGVAAVSLGLARAALDAALKHATTRKQFGKPLADFQAVQFMLADCETELRAAELLVLEAARLATLGVRHTRESSIAKLFASEAASRICNRALQIHGGYGYTRDIPVERYWRDARLSEIGEGSSEVQRIVISRSLLSRFRSFR